MDTRFETITIDSLRPNNWYINREKLDNVRAAWENGKQDSLPPVLVAYIGGEPNLIDGHSRVFAAYENGAVEIEARVDELQNIEGSTALYEHIHREGPNQGIRHISDLADRIVEPDEHRCLWIDYCTRWVEDQNHRPGDGKFVTNNRFDH